MLAGVAGIAGVLYATGLDRVPIHLHHDEVYFGVIADSVAHSLRDPQGRWLPLLFQMGDTHHWYPPLHIYFTALWVRAFSIGDIVVRLPNACIGVANVVLMFFVARRAFHSDKLGLAAAAMMAITPAHFINSRISTDCLYPVMFILMWMLLLLRYLERPATGRLIAASAVLGVGMYAYIASVVMMPVYLLLTLAVLGWTHKRQMAISAAAFALTIIPGAVFAVSHPEIVRDYAAKYELASSGPQLNAFQQAREALTPWNISDHLNLLHSSFSPGYLFVTGGSNLAHSTRTAGVFLAAMAILLVVGIIAVVRRPTSVNVLILAGFLTAPLAAMLVREDFAIPRMLGLVPFGTLLATLGLATMWKSPLFHSMRLPATVAAAALCTSGGVYFLLMLVRQSHVSWSALLMIGVGIAVWVVGAACDRQRSWQPLAVALVVLMPLQFAFFAADYFGDYRARSAARYEYNIRGALEQAIALRDRTAAPHIYLNDDIQFIRGFWDYYLRVFGRRELQDIAKPFNSENGLPPDMLSGSLVVTDADGRAIQRLAADARMQRVAEATDPIEDSPEERTTFVIFQRR